MNILQKLQYKKFSQNESAEIILKEAFRKSIHILSAFVPLLAKYFFYQTIISLSVITILYIIFEFLRINGKKIFLISHITRLAARKRDNGKFVLGPVTLALGIIFTLLIFPQQDATIGILALSFGDGLSSLVGKCFGKRSLKIISDKTIKGSFTCFLAVFITTLCITKKILQSLILASIATFVESLPLKDFDNVLIPLLVAGSSYFLF